MRVLLSRRGMSSLAATVVGWVVLALLFAGWSPGWFDPAEADDPDALARGEQVEFRLVEEFQLIRPDSTAWRLRIRDRDVNAWLATRLIPWLRHERDLEWPPDWSRPQVRFAADGVRVAARVRDLWGRDRVVSWGLRVHIRDGVLSVEPGTIHLGRLPLPFVHRRVESMLRDAVTETQEEAFGRMLDLVLGTSSVEAIIPLVDSREVVVSGIEMEAGAIVIDARTRLK